MARDQAQLLAMGDRIRELREQTGLKQQYVADYCGVKLRTYQFWQQGKHPPEQEALEKLAELFSVSPRYILRGDTPTPFEREGQLDRIEALLTGLAERVGRLEQEPEPPEHQNVEEMVEVLRRATRAAEELLGRQERRESTRDPRSRGGGGRRPPSPPTAA